MVNDAIIARRAAEDRSRDTVHRRERPVTVEGVVSSVAQADRCAIMTGLNETVRERDVDFPSARVAEALSKNSVRAETGHHDAAVDDDVHRGADAGTTRAL